MEKLYELFAKVIAASALIVVVLLFGAALGAFPVKWCWNGCMPSIFGLKEIGFWEAFCPLWLSGALIKASHAK